MQLLYVHNAHISAKKANGIQVIQMCNAFARLGIDVTAAFPASVHETTAEVGSQIAETLNAAPRFNIDTFPVSHRLKLRTKRSQIHSAARQYLRAKRQLAAERVVFTRSHSILNDALALGFRCIYEEHHCLVSERSRLLNWYYAHRLVKNSQQERLLRVITISNALRAYWVKNGFPDDKITDLHDAVDVEDYMPEESVEKARAELKMSFERPVVLYSGSLYANRGIATILNLANDLSDVQFLVLGGNDGDIKYWRDQCCDRSIPNIAFLGHKPHYQVKKYLWAADVLLMIWSHRVPTIEYCSPLKLFEYMAANRLIVGHGFPTIKEVLKDQEDALLANPASYEELKDKLYQATHHQERYASLPASAFEKVKSRFNWQARAESIINSLNMA